MTATESKLNTGFKNSGMLARMVGVTEFLFVPMRRALVSEGIPHVLQFVRLSVDSAHKNVSPRNDASFCPETYLLLMDKDDIGL
jgi:hypothetical protein